MARIADDDDDDELRTVFLVMMLLEGMTMSAKAAATNDRLTPVEAVRCAGRVLDVLAAPARHAVCNRS